MAHGDVEHYRPKGGWVQDERDRLRRPGYYWLAYEWTNLLFACQKCNQSFKRNRFPLADPAARARSPTDDLAAETPLLIDPASEDPEETLGWDDDEPVPRRPGTPAAARAEATVRLVGLDREELVIARTEHLRALSWLRTELHAAAGLVRELDAELQRTGGRIEPDLQDRLTAALAAAERAVARPRRSPRCRGRTSG